MQTIYKLIITIILLVPVTNQAREKKNWSENKFSGVLVPENRIAVALQNTELSQHKYFERYITLSAMLEYSLLDDHIWSIYTTLPYTRKWMTDTKSTRRMDNMHMGTRVGIPDNHFIYLLGMDVELATGDEKKEGIGSKELGSVEPYLGIIWQHNWILSTSIRYNAQTNKQFREKENQEFERTMYFDLGAGYSFSSVDLLIEYKYMYRKDPDYAAISNHSIAPTLNFKPSDTLLISLSMPYAMSKEREYDLSARLEISAYY